VFAQALTTIIGRLEKAKAQRLVDQYALIGGFAVSAWGIPRATHDLDFALALGSDDPANLGEHLLAEFHQGEPDDPLRGVYQTCINIENRSVPVQLVLLPTFWDSIIFHEVELLTIFDCTVPVVSWQSLILLKLYAGGPQDLLDAQQILTVRQPTRSERDNLSSLADKVHLTAAWLTLINH
jgi:hypothetical protein